MYKETLHTQTPIIECKAPLKKGNVHTDYSIGMSVYDAAGDDKDTLQRLNAVFPSIKGNLSFTRSSTDITHYNPSETDNVSIETRQLYKSEFEGTFLIPWKIHLLGVGEDIIVGYEATLVRPDSSHGFRVVHTKIPEFNFAIPYASLAQARKTRTQVDGLPVHLRLDGWVTGRNESDPVKPKRVAIISRGVVPSAFEVADGSTLSVAGQSRFQGKWVERWMLNDSSDKMSVNSVDVKLKGSWI